MNKKTYRDSFNKFDYNKFFNDVDVYTLEEPRNNHLDKLSIKKIQTILAERNDNKTKKYFPDSIEEHARHLKIGDKFVRTYYLADLPNYISPTSIFHLINLPIPLIFSYHIKGINKSVVIKSARQRLSVLESDQNTRIAKGKRTDPIIDNEMETLRTFVDELVSDVEKPFLVSIYISILADSEKELIKYDKYFQDISSDLEFLFNTYSFDQMNAWRSVLPYADNKIAKEHLLQTSSTINLLPFLSRNFSDATGIFLGVNHFNNSLLLVDLFKARNANINIFGTSGSGKSVTAKLMMFRFGMRGIQNIVIDPEGEYVDLVENVGGEVFSFDTHNGIDPFFLMANCSGDITNKIQILKFFLDFFIQKKNKDNSLLDTYIYELFLEPKENITFSNFINRIQNCNNDGLKQDLNAIAYGSLSSLFNSKIILNLDAPYICFDLSKINDSELKTPLMYLIGNIINLLINDRKKQRMIFIDEAHKFLHNNATTSFYIDLVKTSRKRRAGVVTITQNPEDFKERDNSKTIITQAETTILLKQSSASINYIERYNLFKLTKKESEDLSSYNIGEALLIRENEHINIDIFPLENEREFLFVQ